ncbi:hypothetical protein AnigIFM56816_007921 [Aspergillus niger]|nr:hypothetical protein AnigIFM56816_007921 [Aspergillus niger]
MHKQLLVRLTFPDQNIPPGDQLINKWMNCSQLSPTFVAANQHDDLPWTSRILALFVALQLRSGGSRPLQVPLSTKDPMMNPIRTLSEVEASYYTLPRADSYTAISLISISTFTCLLLYYLIFDLSFFTTTSTSTSTKSRPLTVPTTTLLTTTTTTLLSSTFCILLLFHHTHTPTRIASAILLVLTTTAASITNTLLLYFSLPLITIHQRPQAHFQLRIQPILLSAIISTILLFQLPHVIVAPAAATLYKDGHWTHAVTILSRISVTAYCTREILLLAVYTWGVIKYLRPVIHHFHYESTHHNGQRILSTLLIAGCISLILNIANIVAVYTVHSAAAMAFFPFVVSTKVLVGGVAVGRLVGFVGASRQPRCVYSMSHGCGGGGDSRRGSAQPLITSTYSSASTMSGGLGIVEMKDSGGSDRDESPGGVQGRDKEWWYTRNRIGSVDTIVPVAEPPLVHSVGHLVQEMPDLEGGAAGAGASRRMSVV